MTKETAERRQYEVVAYDGAVILQSVGSREYVAAYAACEGADYEARALYDISLVASGVDPVAEGWDSADPEQYQEHVPDEAGVTWYTPAEYVDRFTVWKEAGMTKETAGTRRQYVVLEWNGGQVSIQPVDKCDRAYVETWDDWSTAYLSIRALDSGDDPIVEDWDGGDDEWTDVTVDMLGSGQVVEYTPTEWLASCHQRYGVDYCINLVGGQERV